MASLEELLNSGLSGIIQGGGLPQEEAMYQRQALSDRENLSARGLGISTVTRDALAKARVDASLAAQQAQLAALGQAAGYTTANANRAQQESQFSRGLKQQKDMANTQLLASGLGAGVGALGQLGGAAFGPEIRTGARNLFGLGPLRQDATPNSTPAGVTASAGPNTIDTSGFSLGGNTTLNAGDLSGFGAGGGGSLSASDFSVPDLSGYTDPGLYGGLDLSNLFDSSFNPYQVQDWGMY